MSEKRALKFNELLRQELAKIINNFLDIKPGVLVTVTRVITVPNLFNANIYISVYPAGESQEIFKNLNKYIYQIQQLLNKKLKVRPVPKINFVYDKNPEEAAEIEELLEEVKNDK